MYHVQGRPLLLQVFRRDATVTLVRSGFAAKKAVAVVQYGFQCLFVALGESGELSNIVQTHVDALVQNSPPYCDLELI